MRNRAVGAAVLILCFLASGAVSYPQQAQKKPKSALSSGIDSNASGLYGNAKPSPIAEDGEFLRRVMLDLVGYPPSLEQVKAFMADTNPDKRSEVIDKLLESEEWADRTARLFCEGWFGNWHDVPMMISPALDTGAKQRIINDFVAWLKGKLHKDAPYNREVVDAIIRARGTGTGDPAMLWKLSCFSGGDDGPSIEFANRVSRHFLGIRLRCAQCHDHPFDVWNQKHFYSMAAFFGRTKVKGGTDAELSESDSTDALKAYGGSYMPQFIYGQKPGKTDPWMDSLAIYITGPDNTQLAPAAANRVWSWLFGRGLIHPVDDFNKMNQPLGGGLLGTLAKEFKASKFSIKTLYRGICNSDTYQRASANESRMTKPNFAAAWIKHLDAEQLMNSIQVATGGTPRKDASGAMSMVAPLFPADVVWCEVTPLPGNMRQALFVRNNGSIHGQISGGLSKIQGKTTAEKVGDMFLAVVSRKPTEAETARFVKYIDGHSGQGMEDAYWTLMNTTEFLSRH
ncbi:MAG: DUF1549 domain-containing protein [Planctomycetes bacterium]|nr:DUF1549 domain-containing protein [Planctomycetota bacterium]